MVAVYLGMTKTEMVEVILETICVLASRIFFQILLNIFFEILIPKVKPIEKGKFYRLPNATDF